MLLLKLIVANCVISLILAQTTRIVRGHALLSRRKRYLTFPMNSNLVHSELINELKPGRAQFWMKHRRDRDNGGMRAVWFILNFKAVLGVEIFREVSGAQRCEGVYAEFGMQIWFKLENMTMSYVKALMIVQPRGMNILGECDVPFALPSDTRFFKHRRRNHYLQRREVLNEIETGFFQSGLNGTACLKRMICEAQRFISMERKSLVKDLLSAIFMAAEIDTDVKYQDYCHSSSFSECTVPFLNHILGSILPADTH